MKITIVRQDNKVIIDGISKDIDLSGLPKNIHAVQWDGVEGEIEYGKKVSGLEKCHVNERITSIADFQDYIDAWHATQDSNLQEPQSDLTSDEQVDARLNMDKVLRAVVSTIAENTGKPEASIISSIKAKHRGLP